MKIGLIDRLYNIDVLDLELVATVQLIFFNLMVRASFTMDKKTNSGLKFRTYCLHC